MGRKALELGALQVGRLKTPGLHFVGGVDGLVLQVAPGGSRSWLLRMRINGKRRAMGLGGFPDVSLARAREKAREARLLVDKGIDPIGQRRQARSALIAQSAAKARTFAQCAQEYIAAKSPEWTNPKHAQQWGNSLDTYAAPIIGAMPVSAIGVQEVLAVLKPIWQSKTETASRVRGRMESVLNWAAAQHFRDGPNPAQWKGLLENLLANPEKFQKVKHHAALPIDEMPAFMVRLRQQVGLGAQALNFLVLTAVRSANVRNMTWDEVDLDKATWTVPEEDDVKDGSKQRMKGGREHRVPLSAAAVKLLNRQPRVDGSDLVFPSIAGKPLSDMTLTAVLRRMKVDAVPHGFRSTFRDWCSERTNYPGELAEAALDHVIENKTEAAYRRGDLFDKRRLLMADWADFCAGVVPKKTKG